MITVDDVTSRLRFFRYDVLDEDVIQIQWLIDKSEQDVLNYCNIDAIPIELKFRLIDEVVGEFLIEKASNDSLPEVDRVIKSIKEGDVTVTYGDDKSQLDVLKSYFRDRGVRKTDLDRFRKMVW